ncbi:hypothetical protein KM043_013876 [Ampulex compressa]|nr:hypothetical protein KM043_013876 [Ampulex compressa]
MSHILEESGNFDAVPLNDIHPKILEQHFDNCIIPKTAERNELFIEFDYRSLIPHKPKDAETDFEEFEGPGRSLFKTFIMITGEFEAENIPFEEFPIAGRILFVSFVFFIAIVLFNLLNGLAVSDTVEILSKAELVGLVARIKLVSYVERFVMKGEGRWKWVKRIMEVVRKRVMVFPKGFENSTCETQEHLRNGKLTIPWQEDVTENPKTFKMDSKIMSKAEEILRRREHMTDAEKMMEKLEELDGRFVKLEAIITDLRCLIDRLKN